MTRPSVVRAVKEDLAACGEVEFESPDVRLDIEEDGDFSSEESEDDSLTLLEMASAVEEAHVRICILQGISPTDNSRLTRRQHVLATELLDPPMTFKEKRYRDDLFLCEDDNAYSNALFDQDEAWRMRQESSTKEVSSVH